MQKKQKAQLLDASFGSKKLGFSGPHEVQKGKKPDFLEKSGFCVVHFLIEKLGFWVVHFNFTTILGQFTTLTLTIKTICR